jgi:hypothetical protein
MGTRWDFPPRNRVGSFTCQRAGCQNEFVVDARDRKQMLSSGSMVLDRCPACRRSGRSKHHAGFKYKPRGDRPNKLSLGETSPKDKERSPKPRWKSKTAKGKTRGSPTNSGTFSPTSMMMMVAGR